WPKCFGYYIPPTDPSQVEFHSGHEYSKGMMIIVNDTLWRAKDDFHSGANFRDGDHWEKYPVHDYAKFFVAHTWTEYINRLFGALSGFSMFLLMFIALLRIRKDWKTFAVMVAGMCMMAFVIWLGAVVVNTNLAPFKITFHMLSAMVMVAIVILVQARVRAMCGEQKHVVPKFARILFFLALLLTLDQVIFGTQVRQQIDTIYSNMSGLSRETWIAQLNGVYLYHKIMAGVVMIVNIALFWFMYRTKPEGKTKWLSYGLLLVMLGEYGAGVFMHNFAIPAYAQPVHLLLAMILFGVQLGLIVRTRSGEIVQN
ncbi:MAG TPA: COX15/CtaA family protein, partial [Bacteroidia bacterium]|nr:COX15/CtaA family protein [Bacteroidia bacterium]